MDSSTGDRIRRVRKRRGLSQKELAARAGLSLSYVKKIEQGEITPPVETLRRFAIALNARTSSLIPGAEPEPAPEPAGTGGTDPQTAAAWAPVREALHGHGPQAAGDATPDGVLAVLAGVRPALAANRFTAVRAVLPGLIRDAAAPGGDGRGARSRVLNLTAWLLTQTRQWEDAETAAVMAADAAGDRLDAAAALNTRCWLRLRTGRLAEARAMASAGAAAIEPRFSAATPGELGTWGRLLLCLANAAIRDNRPGEAADALSLARAAADRIGREICPDESTARTFGPASVLMIMAENAAIEGHPDRVLKIADAIPGAAASGILWPASASRRRHRLDVANARVMLGHYPDAMAILHELHAGAPQWLAHQRYARKVMRDMISRRKWPATREMIQLAEAVGLPL